MFLDFGRYSSDCCLPLLLRGELKNELKVLPPEASVEQSYNTDHIFGLVVQLHSDPDVAAPLTQLVHSRPQTGTVSKAVQLVETCGRRGGTPA